MKVSYFFRLDSADVDSIKNVCKKNSIPKIIIEGINTVILPLFKFDDEATVKKYLVLTNSAFKSNVGNFMKSRNYPGEKFLIKIVIDCKRNQLCEIEFSDLKNNSNYRRIQVLVDFEKYDCMYDFIKVSKYDKFFSKKILKEIKQSLMQVVDKFPKKEKTNTKKSTFTLFKKPNDDMKNIIKEHFQDIILNFNSYEFLITY